MTKQEFIQEHKRLVQVLLHGSDNERKNEAFRQLNELKEYTKPKGKKIDAKTRASISLLV